MAKKQLTTQQLKNKYGRIQTLTYLGEYVAMATPYITIGIVNYDKYFTEASGTKMSLSMVMALVVLGFTIWSTTQKKLENTIWSTILKMGILAFICYMMGSLITDLGTILFFGCVGLLGSQGLDVVSNNYKKKKEQVIKATEKANEDILVEQVKKEKDDDNIGAIL